MAQPYLTRLQLPRPAHLLNWQNNESKKSAIVKGALISVSYEVYPSPDRPSPASVGFEREVYKNAHLNPVDGLEGLNLSTLSLANI